MKKVLYIFVIGFGLIATSCQKQDITPTSKAGMEVPEWTNDDANNARSGDEEDEDDDRVTDVLDEDGSANGIEITDPNKPSEGSGGKGGRTRN